MRRKNLWLRLSSCTMAALIATTSIVPVSAAEVEFQDEASTEETETPETAEAELSIEDGFGAANTNLEKGTYKVTVSMMKANDPTTASMANSCIAGKGTLVVAEDGSAKLTVPIQAISRKDSGGKRPQGTDPVFCACRCIYVSPGGYHRKNSCCAL